VAPHGERSGRTEGGELDPVEDAGSREGRRRTLAPMPVWEGRMRQERGNDGWEKRWRRVEESIAVEWLLEKDEWKDREGDIKSVVVDIW
jgi:hypothetical protein